jgi:hypothetical protein
MIELRGATLVSLFLVALPVSIASGLAQPAVPLDQNWSEEDKTNWYDATQGSRLIPRSWLEAIEQPGGTNPFLADEHIAKFRYLPRPGKLPVGFVIDETDDEALSVTRLRWKSGQKANEQWVGFNCAACHTGELTFNGNRIRVEGAPTLADFQGFMETLNRSLMQTQSEGAKFARFATRVLGPADTDLNRQSLKAALSQLVAWQLKLERMNATELRYGYGRLDAFGHIFNKVALVVDAASPTPNPANAPVSYPFLWNVPQQDWLQWNMSAPNKVLPALPGSQPFDIGALGRNTGEVIGVFADVKPIANPGLAGYKSSANVGSLVSMEQMLGKLRPPAWPTLFGVPDPGLVAKGQQLFLGKCQNCHAVLDRTDLSSPIWVKPALFRDDPRNSTDPWMACNAYLDKTATGVLKGIPRGYLEGPKFEEEAPLHDMLAATVIGSLVGEKGEVLKSIALSLFGRQPPPVVVFAAPEAMMAGVPTESLSLKEQRLKRCTKDVQDRTLGYKARPLNGIWATAPYLHNGSVPTLYDLLLPPDDRPRSFWVGSREFDPAKVGFVTTESTENSFLYRTRDVDGRMIDGNSNVGHDYGSAQLTEDDRQALIAYLKTL